ncbi:hypothetical protein [Paenibacillus rhizoplanae]|uniref:Uncharacterized protein n=2 Tax=Paenibacillus TaxID=44249 RepID=A0ABW5F4F3_9BACL
MMNFFHCSSISEMEKENTGVVTEDKLTKLTYTYQQKKDILAAAEKEDKLYNKAEGKKTVILNDETTGKWIPEAFLRRTI